MVLKAGFLDGFCGAGGASLGITRAGCKVIVAVNHDPRAIWAHTQNHPDTLHYNADIRDLNMGEVAQYLKSIGIRWINIWWSAECTHFSNAKGGASRDADSRMLSEELIRYKRQLESHGIEVHWVFVENVREFFSWCPLLPKRRTKTIARELADMERRYCRIQVEKFDAVAAGDLEKVGTLNEEMDLIYSRFQKCNKYESNEDGKITMLPDPKTKGLLYRRWHEAIEGMECVYDHRMLNAADYGAYQSRERYIGIFVRKDLGIAPKFPKPTHTKNPSSGTLFDNHLQPWKGCKDILDLHDLGESILYGRKGRPRLVKASLDRIAYGIGKFGLSGASQMIDRSNTGAAPTSVENPMPSIRATYGNGLVNVTTIDSCSYGADQVGIDGPMPTVMARRDKYMMNAFVVPSNFTNPPYSVDNPLNTLLASRKHQYVCTPFISSQYSSNGKANNATGMDSPVGGLTVNPKHMFVSPFIAHTFSSGGSPCQVSSAENPLWAVTTLPKGRLVTPFLTKYYGTGDNATSIDSPCGTITTKNRMGVVNCRFVGYYHGGGQGNSSNRVGSTESPVNTIATHHTPAVYACDLVPTVGDKIVLEHAPDYFQTKRGNWICGHWGDTYIVNGYRVSRNIIDIHYRMLKVSELKLAQGFPADYILDPNSETVAKKHIGNAVHVDIAQLVVEENCGPNSEYMKLMMARDSVSIDRSRSTT